MAASTAAPREAPRLQPVIAQVGHAPDTDPRRDITRRPAGEDGDRDALRLVCCYTGQPSQRPPGERDDRRGARIARALGQRAVEVGHDQQPTGQRR